VILKYEPRRLCGMQGWSWFLYDGHRLIEEGWNNGPVLEAERYAEAAMVRAMKRTAVDAESMWTPTDEVRS